MIKRYFEVLEPMEWGFKLNPTGKWINSDFIYYVEEEPYINDCKL